MAEDFLSFKQCNKYPPPTLFYLGRVDSSLTIKKKRGDQSIWEGLSILMELIIKRDGPHSEAFKMGFDWHLLCPQPTSFLYSIIGLLVLGPRK
jgi:hypothetical protein